MHITLLPNNCYLNYCFTDLFYLLLDQNNYTSFVPLIWDSILFSIIEA